MPYSHQCPVCDKSLESDSIEDLMDNLEQHLLEHVESKIELNDDFLEQLDQEDRKDFSETEFGKPAKSRASRVN